MNRLLFAWVVWLSSFPFAVNAGEPAPLVPAMTSTEAPGVALEMPTIVDNWKAFSQAADDYAYINIAGWNNGPNGIVVNADHIPLFRVHFSARKRIASYRMQGRIFRAGNSDRIVVPWSWQIVAINKGNSQETIIHRVIDGGGRTVAELGGGVEFALDGEFEADALDIVITSWAANRNPNGFVCPLSGIQFHGYDVSDAGGDSGDGGADGIDASALLVEVRALKRLAEQCNDALVALERIGLLSVLLAAWFAGGQTCVIIVDWIKGKGLV